MDVINIKKIRAIFQLYDGNIIKEYESIIKAAAELKNTLNLNESLRKIEKSISRVCRKLPGRNSYQNYGWEYKIPNEKELSCLEGEIWKVMKNHDKYKISNLGRIWSEKTKRYLNRSPRPDGYMRFTVDDKDYYLQSLIAENFLEKNPLLIKPEVDHINGIKTDCREENLEWVTHAENVQRAHDTGLNPTSKPVIQYSPKGEKIKEFQSASKAAKELNLNKENISAVCSTTERNKYYLSTGGSVFRFKDDPLDIKLLPKEEGPKINQYDLEGNYIRTWNSRKEIQDELGIHHHSLSEAIKCGKYKSTSESQWREVNKDGSINIPVTDIRKPTINQYNLNGSFVQNWKNTEDIKNAGFCVSKVLSVCKNKRNTSGGYIWEYKAHQVKKENNN